MLVLTRRLEESLKIGMDIEIKVLDIKRNSVRLGIVAPKNISIHRKEVYESILNANILASKAGDKGLSGLGVLLKKVPKEKKAKV